MELRRKGSTREGPQWRWSSGQLSGAWSAGGKSVWPPAKKEETIVPLGGSLQALNMLDVSAGESDEAWPQTEAELALYYQKCIMEAQQRHLDPLREDLADWLNKTLELDHLTSDNFMDTLDTGILICHLARIIQKKAKDILNEHEEKPVPGADGGFNADATVKQLCEGLPDGKQAQQYLHALLRGANNNTTLLAAAKAVPQGRIRCWERAAKGSFFSRENACNFLKFCRQLGIHEHLLFESEDLVLHTQPRNVILCLLEVGRVAARLGMEPPGLVQLEREVDLQIQRHSEEATTPTSVTTPQKEKNRNLSELDKKVEQYVLATQAECRCSEKYCERLKIYKISEGLYRIGDRNVFIRLFKDRHVMVRVGGGWDTLEHYLIRHDPCRRGESQNPSRSPTPDVVRNRGLFSNGAPATPFGGSTPCLNEQAAVERSVKSATPERSQVSTTSTRRKYVGRSLTLELNQPSPSHEARRTSSFTTKTKLSNLTSLKEGNLTADLTPEPNKIVGFSFGRAPVARNSSFNSGKRTRPSSAVYNRSKTSDLSHLSRNSSNSESRPLTAPSWR